MPAIAHHARTVAAVIVTMGWDRLSIVLMVLASVTILTILGKVDTSATIGMYSAILGYVFGRTSAIPGPAGDQGNQGIQGNQGNQGPPGTAG